MNFKTGASTPAILNLVSQKTDQLFASCNQKGSKLKLKFEVKLSLLEENVFYRLIALRNQVVHPRKLTAI